MGERESGVREFLSRDRRNSPTSVEESDLPANVFSFYEQQKQKALLESSPSPVIKQIRPSVGTNSRTDGNLNIMIMSQDVPKNTQIR